MIRTLGLCIVLLALFGARLAHAQPRKMTKAPKIVHFEPAEYPGKEKAAGTTGSVVMRLSLTATGEVEGVVVVTSAGPRFDAAATTAARKFTFEPAEIDGKPSAIQIDYRYDFKLDVEKPTRSAFEGQVRNRSSKAGLAGVVVALETGQRSTTDDSGRFVVEDVEPGTHTITVSAANLTTVQTEETFDAGKRLVATYDVDPKPAANTSAEPADDLEIVVVAPPLTKEVASVEFSESESRRVPGSGGDVLKVIQSMPGVNRAAAGSGAIIVWGAAPQDTRVYVDGVRIPALYHLGGLRSVVHSDLVRSVELVPGAYGAAYGRGLGGVVSVKLLELEPGFHGSASADVFDAAASVRFSGGDAFRAAAALRYGYVHRLVPLVTDEDVGELFVVPEYLDGQVRLAVFTAPRTSIEIGAMGSKDRAERVVDDPDPRARRSDDRTVEWGRVYARFRTTSDDGAEFSITPSVGADHTEQVQRFGGVETSLADQSWIFGLRATYRARVLPETNGWLSGMTVTVGLDGEARRASVAQNGSIAAPRREGDDTVFGQAPSDQIGSDTWVAWTGSPAIFGEADVSLFAGKVHLVPGLRVEPSFLSASRSTPIVGDTPSIGRFDQEIFLEPRLAVRFRPSERFELRAAYGLFHQPPAPEDLSAVFGNPALQSSSSHHVLAGFNAVLATGFTADVAGFYTRSSDLTTRSSLASPVLTQALVQSGEGRAYGAQLLLKREAWHGLFGWISYSISRSERADFPAARYRLSDYDQTHVLTAVASYEIGAGFEIGTRFRVASGFPRTPVVGSYYDARTDHYQPLFGETNAARRPLFLQLDARISKRFKLGAGVEVEAYLDVQNVTNHENVEEVIYNADFTREGAITGLPILPVLGVRSSW